MNLTNTGPLPVTILGESPFPNERMGNFRYAQVDLAPYRQPSPADTPLRSHATTDPRTDPTLPPTTLNPGGSIEVWVRYVTGTVPPGPGWAVERDYGIVLKYSVLWMTETAAADTKDGIEMEGGNCASR
jgi:hypothetical protein